MSASFKILSRDVLRLSLAAMLFLASFAGARLQGEMGSFASRAQGIEITLCSGATLGADADGLPGEKRHAQCVLCNLPMGSVADAPVMLPALAVWTVIARKPETVSSHQVATAIYLARGPPQLG